MTSDQARDAMFALLKDEWALRAAAFNYPDLLVPPQIYWQGIQYPNQPDQGTTYARATVRHTVGGQRSLGQVGNRIFTHPGVIIIQCFGPVKSGNGLTIAEGLANIAKDAFEGRSSSSIWFQNCRINEVGSAVDGWYQVNAVADFSYDEVK